MNPEEFNGLFRNRAKALAVSIIKLYSKIPKNDEIRIVGR